MRGVSDEELIGAIAGRDEAALLELGRRYAPHFRAMIARMTGDAEAVDELLQDALVRVWFKSVRFDPLKTSARTWLVTLCHRVAVVGLRRRRVRRLPETGLAGRFSADRPTAAGILAPLDELDPDARRLFDLAFFGGNTHDDLADLTGSQPQAVTPVLQRALAGLHQSFGVDSV